MKFLILSKALEHVPTEGSAQINVGDAPVVFLEDA
jgi:hypothetical protein